MLRVRRKITGGSPSRRQPVGVTSAARQSSSARSTRTALPCFAIRRCTSRRGPANRARPLISSKPSVRVAVLGTVPCPAKNRLDSHSLKARDPTGHVSTWVPTAMRANAVPPVSWKSSASSEAICASERGREWPPASSPSSPVPSVCFWRSLADEGDGGDEALGGRDLAQRGHGQRQPVQTEPTFGQHRLPLRRERVVRGLGQDRSGTVRVVLSQLVAGQVGRHVAHANAAANSANCQSSGETIDQTQQRLTMWPFWRRSKVGTSSRQPRGQNARSPHGPWWSRRGLARRPTTG